MSFGKGVVSDIVMAFQFGANWSVLAERPGSIQGPLLGYETFTAFMLEATFFGVVLLGRDIPYSVTVAAAAAAEASLSFLLWGAGLFVLPVIGVYSAVVYWMFRGKQRKGYTPTSAPPSTVKRS